MKAIETTYKGIKFRSRLEAKWAVFFDARSILWEYEPQGYVIDGRCYLPDFRLSSVGVYRHEYLIEVKPMLGRWPCRGFLAELSEDTFADLLSLMGICRELNKPGFMLFGQPWPNEYFLWPCLIPEYGIEPYQFQVDGSAIQTEHPLASVVIPHLMPAFTKARQERFDRRN